MRRTFTWLPWVLLILVIIGFVTWQQLQKPKAPVAADGVKMPAEKVEPLIDTTRDRVGWCRIALRLKWQRLRW